MYPPAHGDLCVYEDRRIRSVKPKSSKSRACFELYRESVHGPDRCKVLTTMTFTVASAAAAKTPPRFFPLARNAKSAIADLFKVGVGAFPYPLIFPTGRRRTTAAQAASSVASTTS